MDIITKNGNISFWENTKVLKIYAIFGTINMMIETIYERGVANEMSILRL